MPPDTTRAGPHPGEPAHHVVQYPTKATEPSTRVTVARDADRAGQERDPGCRSPSGTAPARPAKDGAVRGDSGTRCDCRTYCAECQLWPLRAALTDAWRQLEALARAA
jgi:hypothetical protein